MANDLESVQIGAITYQIKHVDRLRGDDGSYLYGHIKYNDCVIEIDSAYRDSQRFPLILLHEILHGIIDNAGVESDDEEKIVKALAYGLVDVLARNPELGKMLNAAQA